MSRGDDETPTDPGPPGTDPLGEKNEKVLHTRIPGSLDREIKRRARSLGISVSTVVRNILFHTFDLVDNIVTDSTIAALSITDDEDATVPKRGVDRNGDLGVIGWQEAVLNVNAVCEHCNAILAKGVEAAIGIRDRPGPRTIICTACLGRLKHDGDG